MLLSVPSPCTASTVATTWRRRNRRTTGTVISAWITGAGSGEPRGLDDHAIERAHLPFDALDLQLAQGVDEIAAHGAAEAARAQLDRVVVARCDQRVIDADLAELIDDHGSVGKIGRPQPGVQQRSFRCREIPSAASLAGDHQTRCGALTLSATGSSAPGFCASRGASQAASCWNDILMWSGQAGVWRNRASVISARAPGLAGP